MSTRAARKKSKPAEKAASPGGPKAIRPVLTKPVTVVGIGASAGGLEAFTALLKSLPPDTGMAFALIQHMDPSRESALSQILARATKMPIADATDGVVVKANHIYAAPSHADMIIRDGRLWLLDRQTVAGRHLPIDRFLISLAEDQKRTAIGVILSGTASDGTIGLKTIKAEGGLTLAQDEKSARYPGMPASAVAAGCVDFTLPPQKIAEELVRMSRHSYVGVARAGAVVELPDEAGSGFRKLCLLLRSLSGVDFLQYKPATLSRRIARRMALQGVESVERYLQAVAKDPAELEALYQDILIHVTGFFRDPDAFRVLETKVLPEIVASKTAGQPIRVWVPGCSTGEEVYSIAMLLLEILDEEPGATRIQVFGTDISEPAIQQARSGIYSGVSLANVSRSRLRRFFVKVEDGHQIKKPVRELCIFARHDLTRDPPFSSIDLVSCRNVLIYMGAALQKKTSEVFHYSLRPKGRLFLGKSESPSAHEELFTLDDPKHKIYSRRQGRTPHFVMAAGRYEMADRASIEGSVPAPVSDIRKEVERTLLARFAPPAMVVDAGLRIIHFQGDTSQFVAPATGEPSFHLLRILRSELVVEVRAAIQKTKKSKVATLTAPIRLKNGAIDTIQVEVAPLEGRLAKEGDFLVVFHAKGGDRRLAEAPGADTPPRRRTATKEGEEVARLKQELASAREYLRSTVEDQESTYEELKAANEEVLSANEELQSTNEELETAKEELQSSNEELTTLNEELQNRNSELDQLANDLNNVLVGVNVPIVILDHALRIRRFTPAAEKALNLISTDVGRPFGHISSTLAVTDWDQLFSDVMDHLRTVERDVQDQQGHWYTLRLRPYKTSDNKIEGVLMALFDIEPLKRSLDQVRQSRDYAEAIVETVREPLLVLDSGLRVVSANRSFYQAFQATADSTAGRSIFKLGEHEWNIPRLRQLLEGLLRKDDRIDGFAVDHQFAVLGHRHLLLNARPIRSAGAGTGLILLAIEDITANVEARKALEASESRYRAIVEDQTEFICRFRSDLTVTFVNDAFCRHFGKAREELVGRSVLEACGAEADSKALRLHLTTLNRKHPVGTFTRQMVGETGPWRQWVTRAFFDATGRVVEFQSAGRDITEMKQSEAALLQYQQEVQALKLIAAEEANRKALARELHDVFSQKLAVLGIDIATLDRKPPESPETLGVRLREIADQIRGLAKDIHQMARQLHPAILDDLGLAAALNNECAAFSEHHGIPVVFSARRVPRILPEGVSLCLYRVAQESLRNVAKHAFATRVQVTLDATGAKIVLAIEDVGNGFEIEMAKKKGGLGLISMDERVRLVNGSFSIQSEPGKGTRVEARIPLSRRSS